MNGYRKTDADGNALPTPSDPYGLRHPLEDWADDMKSCTGAVQVTVREERRNPQTGQIEVISEVTR